MAGTIYRMSGLSCTPLVSFLLGFLAAGCEPVSEHDPEQGPGQEANSVPAGLPARPNFLVIVLDTTRPDLLSAYGYQENTTPFLERFAEDATRFDRAYSVSNWTLPSHASLFTGVLPRVHRATQTERRLADSLPTLAGRLSEAGYDTAGFSNNVWVSETTGLDRGFEHFDDLSPDLQGHLQRLVRDQKGTIHPAERHQTLMRVRAWLRRRAERKDERPFFCFVNLIEPHMPYLPPWRAVEGSLGERGERWRAIQEYFPEASPSHVLKRHYLEDEVYDAEDWELMRRLYEGELRVVDAIAERLVGAADRHGGKEETYVFILSDHGENFGDHGHVTHIFNLYDTNVRIPLLVRGPDFTPGAVVDRRVQILDLYPTLLGLAGVQELAERTTGAGRDLRTAEDSERVLLLSMEHPDVTYTIFQRELLRRPGKKAVLEPYLSELRAAIGERFKLIRGRRGNEELYDLRLDPGEEAPLELASIDPLVLAHLREKIASEMGEPAPTGTESADWDDPELTERIRALGYSGEDDE